MTRDQTQAAALGMQNLSHWTTREVPKRLILMVKVKVAQSCPTVCKSMEYTVHGILQARILEWVAIPFSKGSSQPRDLTVSSLSVCCWWLWWW